MACGHTPGKLFYVGSAHTRKGAHPLDPVFSLAPVPQMRYHTPMKHMLMMVMALALLLPCSAGQREEALLGGLLDFGARVLETQLGNPDAPPEADDYAAPPVAPRNNASASAPARSAAAAPPVVGGFSTTIKHVLESLLEEYKEQGRIYAGELGDIVVERVRKDPEIHSTITSLRVLSWSVIAYLTLVTIIMLACLVYLKRSNARLLARVEELCREARRP